MITKILLSILIVLMIAFLTKLPVLAQATTPTVSPDQVKDTTSSSNSVQEKVEEKLEIAKNKPKALLGIVTDITNETMQIKNQNGEIKQISTSEKDTSYAKVAKTSTAIKREDIAIGDYIVAMGYLNNKEVLTAKRLLVTDEAKPVILKSIIGIVTKDSPTQLTLLSNEGSFEIIPERNSEVTESDITDPETIRFSQIEKDEKILTVGTLEDNTIESKRVHILESAPTPSPKEND